MGRHALLGIGGDNPNAIGTPEQYAAAAKKVEKMGHVELAEGLRQFGRDRATFIEKYGPDATTTPADGLREEPWGKDEWLRDKLPKAVNEKLRDVTGVELEWPTLKQIKSGERQPEQPCTVRITMRDGSKHSVTDGTKKDERWGPQLAHAAAIRSGSKGENFDLNETGDVPGQTPKHLQRLSDNDVRNWIAPSGAPKLGRATSRVQSDPSGPER